jgi:FixJ family two-component response regulator
MRGEAFFERIYRIQRATELLSDSGCALNLDGSQLQRCLKQIRPSIPVIFFSAHAGKEEEDQALRCGAVAFLRKPVRRDDLLRAIRMALERTS